MTRKTTPSGTDLSPEDRPACLRIAEDFHIGDLVVHEDHGLSRFEGMDVAAGSDVIRLTFAKDDALLVPATEAGKLWRHGAGEGDLALDALKGSIWLKRRAALRRTLARTASRLVKAARAREAAGAPRIAGDSALASRISNDFQWEETPDQKAAIEAILADLASNRGMDRILVGDVGFGKTEVAVRAVAAAAGSGVQVAILAPTTVLVRQHFETLKQRFAGTEIRIGSLSRMNSAKEARETRAALKDGSIRVVVGTHALLSSATELPDLGLIVVDEEQRFGKAHKRALRRLAEGVHILSMTATPIPGTLQKALVGIKDLSVLATAPEARRPIRTTRSVLSDEALADALAAEQARGGQSFVVVPRIEDIEGARDRISRSCPKLKVRVAHGELPARDLDRQMTAFAGGDGDVLLATTLVESGLDVPRANTMIVLRPDLFGLTQLHQLRGRIGRGSVEGHCLLMEERAAEVTDPAGRRLDTLVRHSGLGAGFRLSRLDLDHRGGGDPSGADQSGHTARIGPALHADLLATAVRKAKGCVARTRPTLHIDVSAGLPDDYVASPEMRATLYNRIGHVRTAADARDLKEEIEIRFGPLPDDAATLLALAELQARGGEKGLAALSAGAEAAAVDVPKTLEGTTRCDGSAPVDGRFVRTADLPTARDRIAAISALVNDIRV